MSELGLGTWGLSGDAYGLVPEIEIDRVIDRAVEIGITLFDTADVYGNGRMQKRLGARLPAATTTVVTKLGTNTDEGHKQFDKQFLFMAFEKTEERLARRPVDVVLLHNPARSTMKKDEPFELMERLLGEGRIKAWGVAAGNLEVAEAAIERGAQVISMAHNCFFFADVEALGPKLREKRVGLLSRSILAHGLLAGHWTKDREFYDGDHRIQRWNPEDLSRRIEQLDAMRRFVGGPVVSLRSVALRFVLENQTVSGAILGPRSARQLDQLVREAGRMPPYLPAGVLPRLRDELRAHGVTGT